ncbi:MAG: hypothetical protein PHH70_02740 [Candidatus Gracilibacteria bacterium]|nr:hypothetical protein [Candidatus Gracilibacteria bacterium]
MSPLTFTLTETPQALISTGSFAELPDFATKIHELVDLFNPAEKEKISQEQSEIQQQKAHLTALLEKLKLSQKGYNFWRSDYEEQLLLSDKEIDTILETEIFRKDGVITDLGKSFCGYLEMVTDGKSEEMKGKMKRKLMRELRLEDRVYQSGNSRVYPDKYTGIPSKRIKCNRKDKENTHKEKFFQKIKQAIDSGIRSLDLSENRLSEKLDTQNVLSLVKQAGESGIRSLELRWCNYNYQNKGYQTIEEEVELLAKQYNMKLGYLM